MSIQIKCMNMNYRYSIPSSELFSSNTWAIWYLNLCVVGFVFLLYEVLYYSYLLAKWILCFVETLLTTGCIVALLNTLS